MENLIPYEFMLPGYLFRVIRLDDSKRYFCLLAFEREIWWRKEFVGTDYKRNWTMSISKWVYALNNYEDRNQISEALKKSLSKFIEITDLNFLQSCLNSWEYSLLSKWLNQEEIKLKKARASLYLEKLNEKYED